MSNSTIMRLGRGRRGGRGACALAGAATLLFAAAACGAEDEVAAPPTVTETGEPVTATSTDPSLATSTEPSEPTATATVTEESSTQPSTNADGIPVPAPERRCQASQLQISAQGGDSAAGSTYQELEFRNVSQSECQTAGYPGVSATDGENGEQLGAPAGRSEEQAELLTLGSGDTATATLRVVNMGDGGSPLEGCEPAPASGVNVFSPGLQEPIYVRMQDFHACTGDVEFMTVSPVRG